ncbi:serine/arginine repetitive matrix protein 1-like [Cloeon dipterum]|uniref:serine/arginine repetitive matrix protein 1-like n=1 Tax=Cloeon dipterum TaxID=197152 RepID=UPI00321F9B81
MRTTIALTMMLLCTLYEIDARWPPEDQDTRIDPQWTPEDQGNDEYLTSDTRHDRTLTNPRRRTWRSSPPANSYNSHPWNNPRKLYQNDELPLPPTNQLRTRRRAQTQRGLQRRPRTETQPKHPRRLPRRERDQLPRPLNNPQRPHRRQTMLTITRPNTRNDNRQPRKVGRRPLPQTNTQRRTWRTSPPANSYKSHPWNNPRKLYQNDELPLPPTNQLRTRRRAQTQRGLQRRSRTEAKPKLPRRLPRRERDQPPRPLNNPQRPHRRQTMLTITRPNTQTDNRQPRKVGRRPLPQTNTQRRTWRTSPPANSYKSHPWNNPRKLYQNDELPLPPTNQLRTWRRAQTQRGLQRRPRTETQPKLPLRLPRRERDQPPRPLNNPQRPRRRQSMTITRPKTWNNPRQPRKVGKRPLPPTHYRRHQRQQTEPQKGWQRKQLSQKRITRPKTWKPRGRHQPLGTTKPPQPQPLTKNPETKTKLPPQPTTEPPQTQQQAPPTILERLQTLRNKLRLHNQATIIHTEL